MIANSRLIVRISAANTITGPELVPGAVQGLGSVVVRGIHEHMSEDDIRDTAAAINKVAHGLTESA